MFPLIPSPVSTYANYTIFTSSTRARSSSKDFTVSYFLLRPDEIRTRSKRSTIDAVLEAAAAAAATAAAGDAGERKGFLRQ